VNIYFYLLIYIKYSREYLSSKNYSTPIWSRVLALLELFGTALLHSFNHRWILPHS